MKPRDTRADAGYLLPNAPPATHRIPPTVLPTAMHSETAAKTACYLPAHAPQFQSVKACARFRPIHTA